MFKEQLTAGINSPDLRQRFLDSDELPAYIVIERFTKKILTKERIRKNMLLPTCALPNQDRNAADFFIGR